jgi:hypothetical protein
MHCHPNPMKTQWWGTIPSSYQKKILELDISYDDWGDLEEDVIEPNKDEEKNDEEYFFKQVYGIL